MSRPPAAKEKILDAYCELLRRDGERAATMDATAALAGVSKGGLLYHFKSKDALAEAVIERLLQASREDLETMAAAEEGASHYFVRTSVQTGSVLDASYAAVLRMAAGSSPAAMEALDTVHRGWLDLIHREVGDRHAAEAIMLIGEGLYYHSTMPTSYFGPETGSLEHLLRQVDRLKSGS
jgi:AcrR family transcriptional regulator